MSKKNLESALLNRLNLEADKPVSSLSVIQLYNLIRFAVSRAISHESDD